MNPPPSFLIVDDVEENRFLLSKTLLRKFPGTTIFECRDSVSALAALREHQPSVVVVHRASDLGGVSLIREIRSVQRTTPIIMVSGRESCPEAIHAGATAFLNLEAWLRIGVIAEEVLSPGYVTALSANPFTRAQDFLGWRGDQAPGGQPA